MTSEARAFRGEPTVAVLLDERAPPGLYALMHLPKRRLQLDGECFTYAGLGDWIGFYDWLRTVAGEVIGVRLWPDEGGASVKALAGHVGVDRAADGGAVCIFFGPQRAFDPLLSDDQDFGGNRFFEGAQRCVLTFNAPAMRGDVAAPIAGLKPAGENAAEFAWRRDDVFARIASRYDLLCDVFSLGIHRLWKRKVARLIAHERWHTLIDGATGTGDIILRVLQHEEAQGRTVIASDVSEAMLAIAERRLGDYRSQVSLERLNVEAMPSVPDDSVDAYSISLCLKICDRRLALREALRVLRPGGRLIVLEASNIPCSPVQRAYLLYMSICMPALGWLATGGDASAYRYLLQGIREFPSAEELCAELEIAGFRDVKFERQSLGIVAIHTARKPVQA